MLWATAAGEWSRAIALAAFVASYVGLALGRVPGFRIDRTGVAIIGAAVMVACGAVPWPDAVAAVDAPTLVLLFGMMIVTAYLRLSGFFRLVMTWALRRARTPLALLGAVVVASGVLSAFFVNDVVCLVLAPVVLEATRQLALPPVPYLVALVTAANVGSVATLTGNPQNMLVGSFSGISYRSFLAREAPIAAAGLVCVFGIVAFVYRRRLPNVPLEITPDTRLAVHHPLMWKDDRGDHGHADRVPGRRADRDRRHHRRGVDALHASGQPGEGVPRDQLGPARALRRPLRGDGGARAHRADRRLAALGGRGESSAPGGAHHCHRGAVERGLQRASGAALQAARVLVSTSRGAHGSCWPWPRRWRAT
jgi:hypothetical protein